MVTLGSCGAAISSCILPFAVFDTSENQMLYVVQDRGELGSSPLDFRHLTSRCRETGRHLCLISGTEEELTLT
jgi:hypothetical protein